MNKHEKMHAVLKEKFGFDDFRPGQAEIISALLENKNALGMLPTGGGKSLIYQMMGYLRPGTVVIVTPLLSLMQDQVSRFNYMGEKSVIALSSLMDAQEKYSVLHHLNNYRFVLISPEMLNQEAVLKAFANININTFVIDEAHTILSWGPDFRPDYLDLPLIHEQLGFPPLLLLTATATKAMQADLMQRFNVPMEQWYVYAQSVDRPNIYLHNEVLDTNADKDDRLTTLVKQIPGAGIVYVSSRKLANTLAEQLKQTTGRHVAAYHGGLDNVARYRLQQQFMQNDLDVIVATSAFGMGIDKDDIRFIIHYHLSQDLASYMQEIGRAGRDNQAALAVLLYVPGDERIQYHLLDASLPTDTMLAQYMDKQIDAASIGVERARLIDYYIAKHLGLEQMQSLFKERRIVRSQALQSMVNYARQPEDLRNYLLQYFDDAPTSLDFESVGPAAFNLNVVGLPAQLAAKNSLPAQHWPDILKQLFK
ncbi:ATP-dependent DNA helicase RecQ [Weissella uvarum]|uniref:RecQ family ATP-dependent DNA helicase n=1 Tax=Weissella uvarum TaxID=1479233 RepID=UPI001961C269|nr:RecQ family ATP-dependent DNA helicase [Weissella uvarum]MBM7617067.1 ATP-dependent DNA helicase RecQ [Weissella uvarum]MCM0595365.1 RecQ family ATP-dependent DNA helicase [Weissella uvarum]